MDLRKRVWEKWYRHVARHAQQQIGCYESEETLVPQGGICRRALVLHKGGCYAKGLVGFRLVGEITALHVVHIGTDCLCHNLVEVGILAKELGLETFVHS